MVIFDKQEGVAALIPDLRLSVRSREIAPIS
jgi:hypothetical protein